MTVQDYTDLAMRTNDGECIDRVARAIATWEVADPGELLNGALGLTGEAGEVADMIKKHIFHGHDLNRDDVIKELGDVCWYVAFLCHAIDVPLEDVMARNIEKLRKRYPDGFSETASINRKE